MDFSRRSDQTPESGQPAATSRSNGKKRQRSIDRLSIISVILLFSVTVLIISIALYAFFVKPSNNSETRYLDTSKLQAVFLNGGQVYFGRIGAVNSKYLTMSDIYYLRVNQQVQPGQTPQANDISLVKLGCELHGPQDQMVVSQDQVIFWENLKDDGQVAKAVAEFKKQNPNGLKCEEPKSNTNTPQKKQ
jgi:hypothetical protein